MHEYDIWSAADKRITSTVSTKAFVDDSDAPYSFEKHEIRVIANSKKDAIKQFRNTARTQ